MTASCKEEKQVEFAMNIHESEGTTASLPGLHGVFLHTFVVFLVFQLTHLHSLLQFKLRHKIGSLLETIIRQ